MYTVYTILYSIRKLRSSTCTVHVLIRQCLNLLIISPPQYKQPWQVTLFENPATPYGDTFLPPSPRLVTLSMAAIESVTRRRETTHAGVVKLFARYTAGGTIFLP